MSRRLFVASSAWLAISRTSRASDTRALAIGNVHLRVPADYLFEEQYAPGTNGAGLPPHFSFAFSMPDGAPAGRNVSFPPLASAPPSVGPDGSAVVLCYRVWAAGTPGAGPVPALQLQNTIIDTGDHRYARVDGMLQVRSALGDGQDDERFVSLVDDVTRTGVVALLTHIAGAASYYGPVMLERPALVMTMYIPENKIAAGRACLTRANRLLHQWENG